MRKVKFAKSTKLAKQIERIAGTFTVARKNSRALVHPGEKNRGSVIGTVKYTESDDYVTERPGAIKQETIRGIIA